MIFKLRENKYVIFVPAEMCDHSSQMRNVYSADTFGRLRITEISNTRFPHDLKILAESKPKSLASYGVKCL